MRRLTSHRQSRSTLPSHPRQGSLAPVAIMALVVVMSAMALVLDKLWIDAAQAELTTAVEAAALSSGRALVTDDLLRLNVDPRNRLEAARQRGLNVASLNRIAGEFVELDPSEEGSIRFGQLVLRDGDDRPIFIETAENPTTVVVTGEHSRARANPIALFLDSLTGHDAADVAARVEASIDNHLVAFRPLSSVPVPILPLAILKDDPSGERASWKQHIELRAGADRFGFSDEHQIVVEQPDGIPEIVLTSADVNGDRKKANVSLFALRGSCTSDDIIRHVRDGYASQDFDSEFPELRLDGAALSFSSLTTIGGSVPEELSRLLGQPRIVFLYDQQEGDQLQCREIVAGRVMSVRVLSNGACEIVFQPTVMITRTAVLAVDTIVPVALETPANKYVYKLQVTF